MNSRGSNTPPIAPLNEADTRPMVRFDRVSKSYGHIPAIDTFSLDVAEKEIVVLLGASGSGKTTLLRLLAGHEKPDQGRILLEGRNITGVAPYRRSINMMPRDLVLFPHLNVEANILFGLKQLKLSRAETRERLSSMLKLTRLEAHAKQMPHDLSPAQRQRVALARTLARLPKVVLLDEPLAHLERRRHEEGLHELIGLQKELGLTFIVTANDQQEAMTMADRIVIVEKGKLVQVASPEEIYERPDSLFVANLFGTVNLFEGTIEKWIKGTAHIAAAAGFTIRCETDLDTQGTTVWIAVRPEKIRLSSKRPKLARENAVEGWISDITYLGGTLLYHVRLAGGKMVRATHLNVETGTKMPFGREDRIWVIFDSGAGTVLTR